VRGGPSALGCFFVRRLLALTALALTACPVPVPPVDAGPIEPEPDAGIIDEARDAGRQRFDAGTPDAGFTVVSVDTWCRTRALASCLRQVRCLSLSPGEVNGCVTRTLETGCDQVAVTMGADAGRLAFDASVALTCLNDFARGSCSDEPAACASVFSGRVAADGGCVTASECGPGAYCDTFGTSCPYRCLTFRRPGETCDFFRRCEPGLACYRGDGGVEVCQPTKPPDAGCVDFDECGDDGVCFSGSCFKRRADSGEPCGVRSGYPFCGSEFFCRQDPPGMTGEEPAPGTCQRRAGLGGVCVGNGTCLPSLRCSTVVTTGTCLAKARRGEICSAFNDCEDGLLCSNQTTRCEPFPADGGDCGFETGSQGRCQAGFFCDFSAIDDRRCLRRRAAGEECNYDQMCLSNECEFGRRPDGGFGGTCGIPCSLKADAGL
jgi:hypothetical protein